MFLLLTVLVALDPHSREEQLRGLEAPPELVLTSVRPRLRASLFAQGVADSYAGRDLGHGLRATAFAEVARTFYAELDGAAPAPSVAGRALLVLSARFGR